MRTFTLAEVSRLVVTILREVATATICQGWFKFIGIALHLVEWVVLVALESIATVCVWIKALDSLILIELRCICYKPLRAEVHWSYHFRLTWLERRSRREVLLEWIILGQWLLLEARLKAWRV